MLHCAHVVYVGCVKGRAALQELMLHERDDMIPFCASGHFFSSEEVLHFFALTATCSAVIGSTNQWLDRCPLLRSSSVYKQARKVKLTETQRGEKLPQSSFGLGHFPQVVSLISCFPARDRRAQSLSVSLQRVTMPGMAAFVQYDH